MAQGDNIPVSAEEEVILLTQVVEEPPIEPVLEIPEGEEDFLAGLGKPPRMSTASPAGAESDDSLADLLATLKELPPDFGSGDLPAPPEPAPATAALPLQKAEVTAIVRQVAAEIIERLAREIVPQVAERLVAAEIRALKEKLCR